MVTVLNSGHNVQCNAADVSMKLSPMAMPNAILLMLL